MSGHVGARELSTAPPRNRSPHDPSPFREDRHADARPERPRAGNPGPGELARQRRRADQRCPAEHRCRCTRNWHLLRAVHNPGCCTPRPPPRLRLHRPPVLQRTRPPRRHHGPPRPPRPPLRPRRTTQTAQVPTLPAAGVETLAVACRGRSCRHRSCLHRFSRPHRHRPYPRTPTRRRVPQYSVGIRQCPCMGRAPS